MMHVALVYFVRIKTVDLLHLRKRSKCTDIADLCLSACEHCGAVNTGNKINLSCKRTDLCDLTTVGTLVILKDHLTNRLLLILVYCFSKYCKPVLIVSECFLKAGCDVPDVLFTNLLLIRKYSTFHLLGSNDLLHLGEHLLGDCA